jgi:hypothetical protein
MVRRFAYEGESGACGERVVLGSIDVNNWEGVFQLPLAVRMLREVLHDARKIYEFEVCGLRAEENRVSFCVKAANGVAAILRDRGSPRKNRSNFEKFEKNHFFRGFFA